MIENSRVGLTLLESERTVVVTKEEFHQAALALYAPRPDGQPRHVAAELVFAPITYGAHAGERGIEVRLDGYRVGELTYAMSQRYAPMVEDVLRRGGRAGAEAHVRSDPRGLQIDLRMPKAGSAAGPRPAGSPGLLRRVPKPLWIAAGVVGTLVLIGTANRAPVAPPASTSAQSTIAAAAPTTQAVAPAPVTTSAAPTTKASPTPSPSPSPQPRPQPQPQPDPKPKPDPQPVAKAPEREDDEPAAAFYKNCDAVKAAGRAPLRAGEPGYSTKLDRDRDGVACEK
ncbi:excalibur calcium-binding domain-containing protein [Actinomycetes bacterium KLBMP 9759]